MILQERPLDPKTLKMGFTLTGMVAMTIAFVFTTFESKTEAQRKYDDQNQNLNGLDQKVNSLHQDLRDSIKEVNAKLDILIQSRK